MGQPDKAYGLIEPQLPLFMGAVFEEICKQYLLRLLKEEQAAGMGNVMLVGFDEMVRADP